jgi:hypothetical protein
MAKFFVVRAGRTQVESSVNYYPDRAEDRAWSIHENLAVTSGYNASCSFRVHDGAGSNLICTGDYVGYIWKLEQASANDDAAAFSARFLTPYMHFGDPRRTKRFNRGFLIFTPQGAFNLTVNIWVDGEFKATTTVSMSGSGGVLGSFILGTDTLGGRNMLKRDFKIGFRGERIQLEFVTTGVNQAFFVSQILVDYMPLGARPS